MKHSTVYADPGVYAGWPANHGAWQRGDEFLVGFLRGRHAGDLEGGGDSHNVVGALEKVQARSLDGGETWTPEQPVAPLGSEETSPVDFECRDADLRSPPPFRLGESIMRVCGVYDHGGEACSPQGGFYLSRCGGELWEGPFRFAGLGTVPETVHNTSRTCVLGPDVLAGRPGLVFLSYASRSAWGSDFVVCVKHDGREFKYLSTVWNDDGRTVMPAVAAVEDRIVVVARRRQQSNHWIDAFASDDDGATWRHLSLVADTRVKNGNPPAIVEVEGSLVVAYGDREACEIRAAASHDRGETWGRPLTLRAGKESDVGYPRLFRRRDGRLVCVYYWSDAGEAQRIEATSFELEELP